MANCEICGMKKTMIEYEGHYLCAICHKTIPVTIGTTTIQNPDYPVESSETQVTVIFPAQSVSFSFPGTASDVKQRFAMAK